MKYKNLGFVVTESLDKIKEAAQATGNPLAIQWADSLEANITMPTCLYNLVNLEVAEYAHQVDSETKN